MPVKPYLDRHPQLGAGVYIDPTALVIGDVVLGDDVSVWPMTVIRGDVNYIRIGARSNVQDGSVLHVSRPFAGNDAGWPLIVGEDVIVGHKVVLHGCTIGDNSLVGMGAIMLNGSKIGNNCLVGAGALITEGKTFPDNSLIVGSPARVVRQLDDKARTMIAGGADIYVRRSQAYAKGLKRIG